MTLLFTPDERNLLRELLQRRFGLEFSDETAATLESAVRREIRASGSPDTATYLARLQRDTASLASLADTVTNNLTRFFRNRNQLELLRRFVSEGHSRRVDVWVVGCSSGEEAYTVAMTCAEALGSADGVFVRATDISSRALETARQGEYPANRVSFVPDPLRERYFQRTARGYRANEDLRSIVEFVMHSVADDAALTGADVALCRNVLTYLSPEAKRAATRSLAKSLKPGGILFIGNAETLPRTSAFTSVREGGARFYRRT